MRSAKIADSYRRMPSASYPASISSATFGIRQSGDRFDEIIVDAVPGVSVVTGGNGAGKTTILRALHAVLSMARGEPIELPSRLTSIGLRGARDGDEWEVYAERVGQDTDLVSTGPVPENIFYIDPSQDTQHLISAFSNDANVEDLIDGVDAASFDSTAKFFLSYVLRREYDDLKCYEVPSVVDADRSDPYFEATSHGVSYSTLGMGRGELSAAYLIWKLSTIPNGSIVILEEPENHLAAFSQGALMDVLVVISESRSITFVVSSHAPIMFQRLQDGRVTLLSSQPDLTARSGLRSAEISKELGLSRDLKALVFTEDKVAALYLQCVVQWVNPALRDAFDVRHSSHGESGARAVVDQTVLPDGWQDLSRAPVRLLVVLDGDQKKAKNIKADAFLPGKHDPEKTLISIAESWRLNGADSTSLEPVAAARLAASLVKHAGKDTHDQVEDIGHDFNSLSDAISILVSVAMLNMTFKQDAHNFVYQLDKLIG